MIKCNVTVCGTISKAAVVRTNNENKAFTAFAVNCVIPARNGIDKTVEISVAKDGEEYNRADYTVGKRVEISGVLTFKKRGDNLYFNLSASEVTLSASNEDSIKGEMHFRGKTGKNIEEKTDKKGKDFQSFAAFSSDKEGENREFTWVSFVNFSPIHEDYFAAEKYVEVHGDLQLGIFKGELQIECKVKSIAAWDLNKTTDANGTAQTAQS